MRAYLPSAGTLGCTIWPGARIAHSQGISPDFYPPHVNVGPSILLQPLHLPFHATTPLHLFLWLHPSYLSGWMCFLQILGCQTSIQLNFLSVLVIICFWDLIVILSMVARIGEACLPLLPSWSWGQFLKGFIFTVAIHPSFPSTTLVYACYSSIIIISPHLIFKVSKYGK